MAINQPQNNSQYDPLNNYSVSENAAPYTGWLGNPNPEKTEYSGWLGTEASAKFNPLKDAPNSMQTYDIPEKAAPKLSGQDYLTYYTNHFLSTKEGNEVLNKVFKDDHELKNQIKKNVDMHAKIMDAMQVAKTNGNSPLTPDSQGVWQRRPDGPVAPNGQVPPTFQQYAQQLALDDDHGLMQPPPFRHFPQPNQQPVLPRDPNNTKA